MIVRTMTLLGILALTLGVPMGALAYNDRIDEDGTRYPKAHQEMPQSFYEAALDVTNTIETIQRTADRDATDDTKLTYREDGTDGGMDAPAGAEDESSSESTG